MENPLTTPAPPLDPEELGLRKSHLRFPVVGIGASAGGLAALQQFFRLLPSQCGMAFVVILHLSPKHESSAAEILQRATGMRVRQVVEPLPIEVDNVYVIPPTKDLSMNDGELRLTPSSRARHGRHTAIDLFFRTLAQVHQENAFCVVLSGLGTDGAVGLARIKELGGVTLAQSPDDAEYDGMPRAAVATGKVDIVLPVAEMPERLLALSRNMKRIQLPPDAPSPHLPRDPAVPSAELTEAALSDIMTLLRLHTRHEFQQYKRATVLRRIERRLQVRGLPDLPAYRDFLKQNSAENEALLQDLLISVTNFFRDRDAFEALEREVIPRLFEGRQPENTLRCWVAGCATGEEAYSLAMLLREQADRMANPPDFQVFATDIDERAIDVARAGLYPGAIVTDVPPSRLRQFFTKEAGSYRVAKSIREKVLFASHNVLCDPPFSRLDLVCCRNLLIYLERRAQTGVLEMFRFALNRDGVLFVGVSESAEAAGESFQPLNKKHRIYRAANAVAAARPLPVLHVQPADRHANDPQHSAAEVRRQSPAEVHRRCLEQVMPPSVLIDANSNILHLSEGAGRYLEHGGGLPTHNLLANINEELRLELRTAIYSANQSKRNVEVRGVRLEQGGLVRHIHLSVRPFRGDDGAPLALVVFEEAPGPDAVAPHSADAIGREIVEQLEKEIRTLKEHLQTTVEQSEASTEELKASNEELQATNEELRSATEELETSKEELQSMNEELTTVNYELKMKVEETGRVNDDLQNLIASTDIATVFVDKGLNIKRFTPQAATLFNLIATDAGRSLLDITHKLDYPQLPDDAQEAFSALRVTERSVRSVDGRHFLARFLPYRTADDKISGAVLTFIDVTALRQAEEKVRAGEERMRVVAETTRDFAIITTDEDGLVTAWNIGATRLFGWSEDEMRGRPLDETFTESDRQAGVPAQERQCALETGRSEDERWHLRKDGSTVYCSGVVTPLNSAAVRGFAKIARDMTDHQHMAVAREELLTHEKSVRRQAQAANSLKDEFLAVMSHELKNPLNLIHVNAELLMRMPEAKSSTSLARAADAILTAARSQSKIIDDLLDLSRVRTGKMTLRRTPLCLHEVLTPIMAAAAEQAQEKGLALAYRGDPGLTVEADHTRLEQIIWNLVSNAFKFTPAGGSVEVHLDAGDGGFARLMVTDTGRGIDPTFLPHLFDMFTQEGRGPQDRGLGIGLALVRELVQAQGGEVTARSAGIGKGSTFTVVFPLWQGRAPQHALPPLKGPSPFAGKRVLVVDDSPDTVFALSELLRLEGAEVETAGDGRQALELLRRQGCDLLLSDLGMPDMDGLQLIAAALALPARPFKVALALTGYGREADARRALAAGFDGHIPKPVSMAAVERVAGPLLRRAPPPPPASPPSA